VKLIRCIFSLQVFGFMCCFDDEPGFATELVGAELSIVCFDVEVGCNSGLMLGFEIPIL
jgi:hypothetical protein